MADSHRLTFLTGRRRRSLPRGAASFRSACCMPPSAGSCGTALWKSMCLLLYFHFFSVFVLEFPSLLYIFHLYGSVLVSASVSFFVSVFVVALTSLTHRFYLTMCELWMILSVDELFFKCPILFHKAVLFLSKVCVATYSLSNINKLNHTKKYVYLTEKYC